MFHRNPQMRRLAPNAHQAEAIHMIEAYNESLQEAVVEFTELKEKARFLFLLDKLSESDYEITKRHFESMLETFDHVHYLLRSLQTALEKKEVQPGSVAIISLIQKCLECCVQEEVTFCKWWKNGSSMKVMRNSIECLMAECERNSFGTLTQFCTMDTLRNWIQRRVTNTTQ